MCRCSRSIGNVLIRALGAALVMAAPPAARAQMLRVSLSTSGTEADAGSDQPTIDHSGRFVAFRSAASNLVTGDTNGLHDIFVRDRDADGDGVYDEPGAVSTTRVSVGTGGVEADGPSREPAIGADGRFVVFSSAARALLGRPTGFAAWQVYRHDRGTGETVLVSTGVQQSPANADCHGAAVSRDGRFVVFTSRATNLTTDDPGEGGGVFLRDLGEGTIRRISPTLGRPSQPMPPGSASFAAGKASISADGTRVAYAIERDFWYRSVSGTSGRISVYDVPSGTTRADLVDGLHPQLSADGRQMGFLDASPGFPVYVWIYRRGGWIDLDTGATAHVTYDPALAPKDIAWSPGARFAAYLKRDPDLTLGGTDPGPFGPFLYDRLLDNAWLLPPGTGLGPIDAAGRTLVFASAASLVAGDTNDAADILALDLVALFDADGDLLDDRWEQTVGLRSTVATGDDGPGGDPDGDGLTNLDEWQQGTHPRGTVSRFFAEGATGTFFDTLIALVNPGSIPAAVAVRFATDAGVRATRYLRLPPRSRRTVDPEGVAGLGGASFAVTIDSDVPVVADRRMSWDTTGYGAHAETSVAAPSSTWYLAEGATGGPFTLFYLLQNPGAEESVVEVRYLRPMGAPPVVKTYRLPPKSRTTVLVDAQDPLLENSDVSAAIVASRPIIVERAMYCSDGGRTFHAGHASAGVAAPAASWFFAEGATGPFFELFLLLANPGPETVTAVVRYTTEAGLDVSKAYALPPTSRHTIWVDEETFPGLGKALADAAVSARVTASAPIVAERAMWWPGGQPWEEGHNSAGATTTATRWVLADGGIRGPRDAQTFVLIANTGDTDAAVRVTAIPEAGVPLEREFSVPANRRFTVDLATAFPELQALGLDPRDPAEVRVAAIVESLGPAPAPIVVERAMYWNALGVQWAAGTNSIATPVP